MRPVYLEASSIISSLGFTTDENIEAILAQKSGVALVNRAELSANTLPLSLIDRDRVEVEIEKIGDIEDSKYTLFEQLIIVSIKDALSRSKVDITSSDTLFILSTTKGNIDKLSDSDSDTETISLWSSASKVMNYFKVKGDPLIISNACISGAMGLLAAKRVIDLGGYSSAVVVGADLLSEFIVSGFEAFKSLSSERCRPFDQDRDGLNLGEGIATQIVTLNDSAGAIQIVDGAVSNDANHISGPSRTGEGLKIAIEKVTDGVDHIDYISCHGTATPYNDAMEGQAILRSGLKDTPIVATKAYTGHTLGAAGIIEAILCAEFIKRDSIVSTLGYNIHGVDKAITVNRETKFNEPISTILKVASGFGGCNVALLLSDSKKLQRREQSRLSSLSTDNIDITTLCSVTIESGKLYLNDKLIFTSESCDFDLFSKELYREREAKYSKFFKMDRLSKLGILASDALLSEIDLSEYSSEDIAIVVANASSSINNDKRYQDSLSTFPSPALFVYTLPNIVVGEIAIKNSIKGETISLIQQSYNPKQLRDYSHSIFKSSRTTLILEGWLEVDIDGNYSANMKLITI